MTYDEGVQDERDAIIVWLRQGGETINGKWCSRDREMHGYYKTVADRIASGDHHKSE